MDFFTVPTLIGSVLFVLVLLTHHRRRIVHLAITEHPTARSSQHPLGRHRRRPATVLAKDSPANGDCLDTITSP
jgi:hypothetical protein